MLFVSDPLTRSLVTRDTQLQQPDLFLSKLFTAMLGSVATSAHLLRVGFCTGPSVLKHETTRENRHVGAITLL